MKNTLFFLIGLFTIIQVKGQVFQGFESGSSNNEMLNCWQFSNSNVIGGSSAITGSHAMRTDKLNTTSVKRSTTSPWVLLNGSGQLTFKTKLISNSNGTKNLDVKLIDQNGSITTILSSTYSTAAVQTKTINITQSGYYQVKWELYGNAGNTRGVIDDISIPGTFAANPGNNPNGLGNCAVLIQVADADNDGVLDSNDDYPNDATRAYNNYYPSAGNYNTLAYEDLWPAQGDFDFNDLVIDYNINEVKNASNEVVEVKFSLVVAAVGGTFENGFGIQFDNLTSSDISSVTGYDITGSLVSLGGNGVETGQSKAVVIAFDNAENVINRVGGSFYNTLPNNPSGVSDTVNLTVTLATPMTAIGQPPYNPFLIKNQVRGNEIHLADHLPTDLANQALFGSAQDDSSVSSGKYYKSVNNLPWALDISGDFNYPAEGNDIVNTYLEFVNWATSNGTSSTDWYSNTTSGYRNTSLIY